MRDALGDALQQCEGDILHGCGHGVYGVDCAKDNRVGKRARIVAYAHGLEIRHYGKVLPNLAFKAVFANSSRRIASDSRTASSRSRVMAPRQRTPRPGPEGLAIYHAVGQAERFTYDADFVLEQEAKRLNELKL